MSWEEPWRRSHASSSVFLFQGRKLPPPTHDSVSGLRWEPSHPPLLLATWSFSPNHSALNIWDCSLPGPNVSSWDSILNKLCRIPRNSWEFSPTCVLKKIRNCRQDIHSCDCGQHISNLCGLKSLMSLVIYSSRMEYTEFPFVSNPWAEIYKVTNCSSWLYCYLMKRKGSKRLQQRNSSGSWMQTSSFTAQLHLLWEGFHRNMIWTNPQNNIKTINYVELHVMAGAGSKLGALKVISSFRVYCRDV